jgi:tricorn protease
LPGCGNLSPANLGLGGARPDDDAPRPELERFDLKKQSVTVLENVDWFRTSGDGRRIVVSDHGSLTLLPADRKADTDNPDDEVGIDAGRLPAAARPGRHGR